MENTNNNYHTLAQAQLGQQMFVFGAVPAKAVVKPQAPIAQFANRKIAVRMSDGSPYDAFDCMPSDCNLDSLDQTQPGYVHRNYAHNFGEKSYKQQPMTSSTVQNLLGSIGRIMTPAPTPA